MLDEKAREVGVAPTTILKADPDNGVIRIDGETTLSGIAKTALYYRLGNRWGLEWIFDQKLSYGFRGAMNDPCHSPPCRKRIAASGVGL